jgi:lipopolysaccharide export system protein LptC
MNGSERWDDRLVHSAQGYVARAFRVSQREALHQARRYSTIVRFLKRALPLAALALILAVVGFALQPREAERVSMTFERMGQLDNDLAMVNPRLTGTDDKGLPFIVSAASAVQEGPGSGRVRLNDIRAEMTLDDGTLVHVTAAQGLVDTGARQLDVTGGIKFSSADGYVAETSSARADLRTGIVTGNEPVKASGKFGELTANGFTFDKDTKKLRFDGNVRMRVSGAGR